MATKDRDCPRCQCPARRVEHLENGWRFCPVCAKCFQLNEAGELVTPLPVKKA